MFDVKRSMFIVEPFRSRGLSRDRLRTGCHGFCPGGLQSPASRQIPPPVSEFPPPGRKPRSRPGGRLWPVSQRAIAREPASRRLSAFTPRIVDHASDSPAVRFSGVDRRPCARNAGCLLGRGRRVLSGLARPALAACAKESRTIAGGPRAERLSAEFSRRQMVPEHSRRTLAQARLRAAESPPVPQQ